MRLFRRFLLIIAFFLVLIFLGLSLKKEATSKEAGAQIANTSYYYTPDINGNNASHKAIVAWALKFQEQIELAKKNPLTTIRCYLPTDKKIFYQKLIKGDVDWIAISEVQEMFEKRLGFNINLEILSNNELQHIIELLFIDSSSRTISISAKYLTEISKKKHLFGLNQYFLPEQVRLPFLYDQGGFTLLDEMLLVSEVPTLWPIIQAKFIARTRSYQKIISGALFAQAPQKDISEKIVSWAKKNPMALFYLPSIKEYCFGKAFWTELFWEKRAQYLAINAKELDEKFFKPITISPTFLELSEIFQSEAENVGAWLALVGYLYSCKQASAESVVDLRQRLYILSPQAQQTIRTLYPSIYEHYLSIVTPQ